MGGEKLEPLNSIHVIGIPGLILSIIFFSITIWHVTEPRAALLWVVMLMASITGVIVSVLALVKPQ
jgi:hypothetical protein